MKQRSKTKKHASDYYYKSRLTNQFKELKKIVTAPEYRLFEKYETVMINESLADATRCKHFETILSLTRILSKKSWLSLSQNDIDGLVTNVMRTYSDDGKETNTTYDHKKILKIFFRWVKLDSRSFRDVGNPPEIKNVKQKQVAEKIVREELVTDIDLKNMLAVCNNLRDKALLHVHYEAGTRPGELLSLKIKHVRQDKIGMIIAVDGKTGARPIRLIESVPSLSKWITSHPFKDDPESPLWINFTKNRYGTRLSHATATRILYQACRKARINKKINLKLFRHSEATRTAIFMTESTLRKRHGWSPTSKMPAKYAHINQQDVEDALLDHYGIKKQKDKISRVPIICPGCKNPNSFDAEICDNCSKPLSLEKALELEESEKKEKDKLSATLDELMKAQKETRSRLDEMSKIITNKDEIKEVSKDDLKMFAKILRLKMNMDPEYAEEMKEFLSKTPGITEELKKKLRDIGRKTQIKS